MSSQAKLAVVSSGGFHFYLLIVLKITINLTFFRGGQGQEARGGLDARREDGAARLVGTFLFQKLKVF